MHEAYRAKQRSYGNYALGGVREARELGPCSANDFLANPARLLGLEV